MLEDNFLEISKSALRTIEGIIVKFFVIIGILLAFSFNMGEMQ